MAHTDTALYLVPLCPNNLCPVSLAVAVLVYSAMGNIVSVPEPSSCAGPSQLQHLTITVLSNSSLTAEWVEPTDDGGDAAINYTITLQWDLVQQQEQCHL